MGGYKLYLPLRKPTVDSEPQAGEPNIKIGRTQGIAPTESDISKGGRGEQRPYGCGWVDERGGNLSPPLE